MTKIKCEWTACKFNTLDEFGLGDCLAPEVVYGHRDEEIEHECGNCGTVAQVICDETLECKTFEWRNRA